MDKLSEALAEKRASLNGIDDFENFTETLFDVFIEECDNHEGSLSTIASHAVQNRFNSTVDCDLVAMMLTTLANIARLIAKPKAVHQAFIDAGIEVQRAEQFAIVWRRRAGDIVDKLKHVTVTSGNPLQNVDWKVSVQTESNDSRHQKLPFVELNLGFNDSDSSFNLTSGQLKNLYDTLESVQSKLDELHQQES